MRLAICASHPIQYQAPLFRRLARQVDLTVLFADKANPSEPGEGFSVDWDWDVDLLSGYEHRFLRNVSARPGVNHFSGCDTPEVGKILRAGRFDAVLLLGWHLKTFHQALVGAKMGGIPVLQRGDSQIGTPRSAVKKVFKAIAYPVFLRAFDAALAVGSRSREYWRHYGYPETRIFFAPHGVDSGWFNDRATREAGEALRARVGATADECVVLFAGKLIPKKRPLDLVAAVGRLNEAGRTARVLVAGSGPLEMEMASLARSSSVRMDVLGFCNQSAMPAVYAAADALVLPSDGGETWGLVANEALACGTPVILSDRVGSAPDLVGDRSAGLSFPMGDVPALAEAIVEVMKHPPSPEAIAAKSREYSIDVAVSGICEAVEFVSPENRAGANP